MSTLFILYTILLALLIVITYLLVSLTIKKSINFHDWINIYVGLSCTLLVIALIKVGIDVNDKLSLEFKVPRDIYTNEYVSDSILTDRVLYNHLLDMRVPHAKIVLCQAKIESADYSSVLFKRQFNLFGMKIPESRPTSGESGKAGYQSYNNWRESVTDYVLWQFSHNVDKLSQEDYLKYLGKIYAEDPKYVEKIKKLLNTINFKNLE